MSFKIAQFNVENLFIYMDLYNGQPIESLSERQWRKLSSGPPINKSLKKIWGLAAAIEEMNPDLLLLNEVGGLESLKNFNYHFLGDQYICHLLPGNSARGIDVGFLLKKHSPYDGYLFTNKEHPINFRYPHESPNRKSHVFSRDVLELHLKNKDDQALKMIVLLVHLKSKLDPEKIDAFGSLRREAEVKALVEIYNERTKKNVPVIVAGDFNGNAGPNNTEHEFQSIYENSDLNCCLELANKPLEERMTQIQVLYGGKIRNLQLDYIFLDKNLGQKIVPEGTYVYRYSIDGVPRPLPKNFEQRCQLPSDHYPVVLELDI